MRLLACILAFAFSDTDQDQCDLQQLLKPKFAERWSCDKPIENEKVPKKTKCEIVCTEGYDVLQGKHNGFKSLSQAICFISYISSFFQLQTVIILYY